MTLREKELKVCAGNPGAVGVVRNLGLGLGPDKYEAELDRLIEEGATGEACYVRRHDIYNRLAGEHGV